MLELTDEQKMIVVVGRWRNLRPLGIINLIRDGNANDIWSIVLEYYRSYECKNRVSALQEIFGDYGS